MASGTEAVADAHLAAVASAGPACPPTNRHRPQTNRHAQHTTNPQESTATDLAAVVCVGADRHRRVRRCHPKWTQYGNQLLRYVSYCTMRGAHLAAVVAEALHTRQNAASCTMQTARSAPGCCGLRRGRPPPPSTQMPAAAGAAAWRRGAGCPADRWPAPAFERSTLAGIQ